jgi:transposase
MVIGQHGSWNRSARLFAAWLGLIPKDHSTAGRFWLGVITRAGDEAFSVLLVGATTDIQQVRRGWWSCSNASRRSWGLWPWPIRSPGLPRS